LFCTSAARARALGTIALEHEPRLLELPLLCLETLRGRLRRWGIISWCQHRRRRPLPYRGFSIRFHVLHESLVELRQVAFQWRVITPSVVDRPGDEQLLRE